MAYAVILEGGSPWGFRLHGGLDFNEPMKIGKLNPNSKAYNQGVAVGDYLDKINGTSTSSVKHNDALQLIRNANSKLELELRRGESKKKSVIPEILINGPGSEANTSNGHLSDSDYYYSSCDEDAEGIVRTNAITNYHSSSGSAGSAGHQSDGDGSSSGSQSSVVHVVAPYNGPLADKMKNINNSTHGPDEGESDGRATPQTTVWSPFGVNKVRSYKPVSFSAYGGVSSPTSPGPVSPTTPGPTAGPTPPVSQKSPAFNTSPSFANTTQNVVNTQQNIKNAQHAQNFGGVVSPPGSVVSPPGVTSPPSDRRELGPSFVNNNTSSPSYNNNTSGSNPSYNNFNGSSSVVVTSAEPGSSYTSITMNSRRVADPSPTHQFSRYGSPIPPSSPALSRPFSPPQMAPVSVVSPILTSAPTPQSPTKAFTSNVSVKSTSSSPLISSVKSPFGVDYRPMSPVKPAFGQPAPDCGLTQPSPGSPTKPSNTGFKLGNPPKTLGQSGNHIKTNFMPLSPRKSALGPFPGSPKVQRRPLSPTKTVTFGPVTSLEGKPQEVSAESEGTEQKLSVFQQKSLFEQDQQQKQLQSPLEPAQPWKQPPQQPLQPALPWNQPPQQPLVPQQPLEPAQPWKQPLAPTQPLMPAQQPNQQPQQPTPSWKQPLLPAQQQQPTQQPRSQPLQPQQPMQQPIQPRSQPLQPQQPMQQPNQPRLQPQTPPQQASQPTWKQPSQPRSQAKKTTSPATTPKQFGHVTGPTPHKPLGVNAAKSPPSNITVPGAIYRPTSPRTLPKQTMKALPLSPYTPPKSPPNKSKGLEMFLTLQKKLHEPEDDLSEFTDSEDVIPPKPVTIVPPSKPVTPSPVIGRAMPMKVNSQVKEVSKSKEDLNLNNNDITAYTGIKSLTPTSPNKSAPWVPSQATTLIDKELEYRERERVEKREQERERERLREKEAELKLRNTPTHWGSKGGSELAKSDLHSMHLDASRLSQPEPVMRCESPSSTLDDRFAWKPERTTTFSSATVTTTTTTATATHHTPSSTMSYASHNGSISHHMESRSGLPTYQSPTITLLQKSRENELPKEAILMGMKETIDGDKKHMDSYYLLPGNKESKKKSQRIVERKTSKYEGIGPIDEQTGIPIIPRGSVDERAHKDWYKRMYQSLHKSEKREDDRRTMSDSEDINTYQPTYVFPEDDSESEVEEGTGSTMSVDRMGYGKRSFTLPNARYRNEKYKVQPRSIENYEPGFSSIAFRERKAGDAPKSPEPEPDKTTRSPDNKPSSPTKADLSSDKSYLYNPPIEKPGQFSKYIYSDSEPDLKKRERPLSPQSDIEKRDTYKRIQQGGEIPYEGLHFPIPPKKENSHPSVSNNVPRQRHSVSGTGRSPTGSWDSRQRRDEEAARRKEEMRRITAEERAKRLDQERRANAARRHNDFLTEYIKDKLDDKYWLQLAGVERDDDRSPSQKSPIPLNRYDDEPDVSNLQRPNKKVRTEFRGKARALYNFKPQNTKELSFRKNDMIYLLRQIDKNWYEGEHHGLVGIFPVNYVEVLMSLDEARQAAILREGQAKATHSFKAQSGMEVSFRKGDTVSLIRRIDNNWFEGRVDGKHGIFPVSYVEVLCEPDTPLPTPMSSYAPTPATGSPGQLSPVSTISNGPAPTIPSAPISPRSSVDNFDFGQPFDMNQYTSASLQRGSGREQSYGGGGRDHSFADYGLDPLNMMRPASALGGPISDPYGSMSREVYNPANRPSSAVPFSDYSRNSTRDSGFHSSEDSKYSRQKQREQDLMRSLSNPYEARQKSYDDRKPTHGQRTHENISRQEEPRYPPYKALYTYRPQNADELELREGDVVYVMERCDDDWYVGTSERTKEFGTFPGNYVKPL